MEVLITVVIATHNRFDYLIRTLQALAHQSISKKLYEVLVVDNASTDETYNVVLQFATSNPEVKYIYEAIPSANLARNIGWQRALGDIVAYIDDDAIPAYDWLEMILKAFHETRPIPGIVGGKVTPIWESKRPIWLHDKLLGALSLVDYSETPCFLEKKYPFSVNMAFRKELLKQFGGFDLNLGRKGKKLLSGDETAIAIRIKKAGYKIYYDPLILVQHIIPLARLNHDWFAKRYFWAGYSEALMWRILENPNLVTVIKKLSFYIYGFARNPFHIKYLVAKFNEPYKFWFKCTVHARIGYIIGLLGAKS